MNVRCRSFNRSIANAAELVNSVELILCDQNGKTGGEYAIEPLSRSITINPDYSWVFRHERQNNNKIRDLHLWYFDRRKEYWTQQKFCC